MDDKLNETHAAPTQDPEVQARLQRERRRRFIRLGAGSVPVGLTLTSRPVMAWHCYTTSAWGSQRASGVAAGTSVYNRLESNVGTTRINGDECWYIDNWVNNTGRSGGPATYAKKPWTYIGDQLRTRGNYTDTDQANYAKGVLKVSTVFPNGGLVGYGSGSTTKCWDVIKNGVTTVPAYILIAGLNRRYADPGHKAVMSQCLKPNAYTGPDQLDQMAKLGTAYVPPGQSVAWDLTAIKTYLSASYLAV